MIRKIAAVLGGTALAVGLSVSAASASRTVPTALQCATTPFDLNNHYGGVHYDGSFFVEGNPTDLCLNDGSTTFTSTTVGIVGSAGKCMIYAGPKNGYGNVEAANCNPTVASQLWSYIAGGRIINGYANGYLTGKVAGGFLGMAPNSNSNQQSWRLTNS